MSKRDRPITEHVVSQWSSGDDDSLCYDSHDLS